MTRFLTILSLVVFGYANSHTQADAVDIIGGQTNIVLDLDTLEAAASLTLSGTGGPVIAPGNLDPGNPASVAFPINARDAVAPALPTTFSYDPADFLNTFSGTIEHSGTVLFNSDTVEVGNFTIAFDAGRAGTLGGAASGFYVESTTGIAAILFDVELTDPPVTTATSLQVPGNLLVSPEFGDFLLVNQLSTSNLAGAVVGQALVEGVAVPEPSSLLLLASGVIALATRRRRNP